MSVTHDTIMDLNNAMADDNNVGEIFLSFLYHSSIQFGNLPTGDKTSRRIMLLMSFSVNIEKAQHPPFLHKHFTSSIVHPFEWHSHNFK